MIRAYGIDFFVSGAGAMTSYLSKTSEASLLWSGTGYSAFTSFEATEEYLSVIYIRYDDVVVYNYTLWKNESAKRSLLDDDGGDDGDDGDEETDENGEGLTSNGDISYIFHSSQFSFTVITKVLGISMIVAAAIALFAVALYFVIQRPKSMPLSPRSKGRPHKKTKGKKKNLGFHSLPIQDEDEENKLSKLHLSNCNEENILLTSSLHSPRPASLSLPYPKAVDARNHKKNKSMPTIGNVPKGSEK